MENILLTRQFVIETKNKIWLAIEHYKNESADFTDALIAIKNLAADCEYSYTLDKFASGLEWFKIL